MLDVIEDEDLVAHAGAMGELLRSRLREATAAARRCATSAAGACSSASTWRERSPAHVAAVLDRAREQGVLIGTTGPALRRPQDPSAAAITAGQIERVAEVVAPP